MVMLRLHKNRARHATEKIMEKEERKVAGDFVAFFACLHKKRLPPATCRARLCRFFECLHKPRLPPATCRARFCRFFVCLHKMRFPLATCRRRHFFWFKHVWIFCDTFLRLGISRSILIRFSKFKKILKIQFILYRSI